MRNLCNFKKIMQASSKKEGIMNLVNKASGNLYFEEIISKAKIQEVLIKAFDESYLELRLILNTPNSFPFELASLIRPLFYETDLRYINNRISKIMNQK